MEIKIRKALLSDAPQIGELIFSLGYFQRWMPGELESLQAQVGRELAACLEDGSHSVYAAETPDGTLAGYASVHWLPYLFMPGPEGYVSELFVREDQRGQGAGSALLDAIKAEARERGCARLSLINMRGRESYQRKFYEKLGWEERPDAANFIMMLHE